MKVAFQKNKHRNLFSVVFVSLFLSLSTGFTTVPPQSSCSCPTPGVEILEKVGSTITFGFNKDESVDVYKIRYYKDGQYSAFQTVVGYSHTYSNLPSGTYDFIITAKCGSDQTQVIIDDIIM